MELFGFYDEPYAVRVERPPTPRRTSALVKAAHAPRADTTTSNVAALWETTELVAEGLDRWKPHVVARRRLDGRRTRVSSIAAAVVGVVIVALMAWTLSERPTRLAEESTGLVRGDAVALKQSLPPLANLVSTLGEAEAPGLAVSTAASMEAETAARTLFTDAGRLPDDGDPRREAAVAAASTVLDVTGEVNRLVAYRLATENGLIPPELPMAPRPADLPAVTQLVTGWRANVESAMADVAPTVLPDHRASVESWVASLAEWQTRYLDAVRLNESDEISAAARELREQIETLERTLLKSVAAAGGELHLQLVAAEKALDRLLD